MAEVQSVQTPCPEAPLYCIDNSKTASYNTGNSTAGQVPWPTLTASQIIFCQLHGCVTCYKLIPPNFYVALFGPILKLKVCKNLQTYTCITCLPICYSVQQISGSLRATLPI